MNKKQQTIIQSELLLFKTENKCYEPSSRNSPTRQNDIQNFSTLFSKTQGQITLVEYLGFSSVTKTH